MDTGDLRGAIDCFNEGISFNPNAVSLYNMKAACHKALEMHTEAYFDYSFTIRLEPDVGAHYCARGLCLARLKKASMAIEDLDVAVQLDPSPAHYYARATTFAEFGKFELSIDGNFFSSSASLVIDGLYPSPLQISHRPLATTRHQAIPIYFQSA